MDLGRDVVVALDDRESGTQDSVLARATVENMAFCVSRRLRWYRSLTTLDKKFRVPDTFNLR